ncbi:MAG: hypothetical protein AB1457_07355 [Chloroflexota bacterium]|nr:MAG: hypothetical protein KatS3mg045_1771 [Bellilinea sp.]
MKKIWGIRLVALIVGLGMVVGFQPGLAQSGDEGTSRLFLPLISRMMEPVWLGPESADVVTIAYDQRVEDRVYLGTWGAGVFVSDDGGITWRRMSNGLENLYIQRLAVDPQQAGVVYAGTYGNGIYKTSDGGWNWYSINQGLMNGAIVYGLVVDPQQSNRLYASARVANRNEQPWGGVVYRSLDGGMSWQAVLQNIGGNNVQDWVYSLAVDPQNPQRVLAASHEHGAYRSLDYGSSWTAANRGITDLSGRAVTFDPRGTVAYLGVWHRTGEFKTFNGGDEWLLQSNGLEGSKIYDMVVNPRYPNQLLAATFMMNYSDTERGVARSENGGEVWVKSGLQPYFIYAVAVNPFNGNEVLAGTVDHGVFRSTDGGKTWMARNQGLINVTITDLLINPANPLVWYAAVEGRGVWFSTDGGLHWEKFDDGLENMTVYSLSWEGQNNRRILARTDEGWLAVESSGQQTWQPVETPQNQPDDFTNHVWMIRPPSQPPKPGFELESGENYPPDWTPSWAVNFGSEYLMAELPSDLKAMVYIAFLKADGTWLLGTSEGIYRQIGKGGWQLTGLRGHPVTGIAVDPHDSNWMAAATPLGLWLSRDGGGEWQKFSGDWSLTNVQGLWFDGRGNLLVSIGGQGLLRFDLP